MYLDQIIFYSVSAFGVIGFIATFLMLFFDEKNQFRLSTIEKFEFQLIISQMYTKNSLDSKSSNKINKLIDNERNKQVLIQLKEHGAYGDFLYSFIYKSQVQDAFADAHQITEIIPAEKKLLRYVQYFYVRTLLNKDAKTDKIVKRLKSILAENEKNIDVNDVKNPKIYDALVRIFNAEVDF
ncbi:hypothetical protein GVAV_000193 [Gurleya vavrai]